MRVYDAWVVIRIMAWLPMSALGLGVLGYVVPVDCYYDVRNGLLGSRVHRDGMLCVFRNQVLRSFLYYGVMRLVVLNPVDWVLLH